MRLALAVVRDYRAERWPSMDLCADELLAHLPDGVRGVEVAPPFQRLFSRVPGCRAAGFNADRLLNRHLLLPPLACAVASGADFVHIADHSYAHLALSFPRGRVGVYCHDLDAFRCVLEPERDRRPRWFRAMARRILAGLKRSAVIFHSTEQVRAELLRVGIAPAARLVHAPYGVAAEFTPHAEFPVAPPQPLDGPFLLHVGSDMPRKRMDVLLELFAASCRTRPELKLVQVGPPWSDERMRAITRLGIAGSVVKLSGLSRLQLAEVYRHAAVVLVPSEAEGFGLPVIEALACGTAVVASDIPVLREVGGTACAFAPVGDVPAWASAVSTALTAGADPLTRKARLDWSARYTWTRHAATIADSYRNLTPVRRVRT